MRRGNSNNKLLLSEIIMNNLEINPDVTKFIDDIPIISRHHHSKKIWKYILENNCKNFCSFLSNKKMNPDNLDNYMKLWLLSLDYSAGTDVLLFIFGNNFIVDNEKIISLIPNLTLLTQETEMNLIDTKFFMNTYKLGNLIDYLKITSGLRGEIPEFRQYIYNICIHILQNVKLTENEVFFVHYYLSLNGIEIIFRFDSDEFKRYIDFIFKFYPTNINLRNMINSPHYKDIFEYLVNTYKLNYETLERCKFFDSRLHSVNVINYMKERDINPRRFDSSYLVNGVHVSILKGNIEEWNREVTLSLNNKIFIIDWYNKNGFSEKFPIIWRNLKVNVEFMEQIYNILESKIKKGEKKRYKIELNSKNIIEPIGKILTKIKDDYPMIEIDVTFDYENTETRILYDLLTHNFRNSQIRNDIILHNNYTLKKILSK